MFLHGADQRASALTQLLERASVDLRKFDTSPRVQANVASNTLGGSIEPLGSRLQRQARPYLLRRTMLRASGISHMMRLASA